jgi:hypothetical protein
VGLSVQFFSIRRLRSRSGHHLTGVALAAALLAPGLATAQLAVPPGGSFSVPSGSSMDLACTALAVDGTLLLGSGQLDNASSVSIAAGGTLHGGQGTLNVSGHWSNNGSFVPGTSTVAFSDSCSPSGSISISGNNTFHTLVLTGASRTFVVPAGSSLTVNQLLRLEGSPGSPLQIVSSDPSQTAYIRLSPGAQLLRNYANLAANVQIVRTQTPTAIPTLEPVALLALSALLGAAVWLNQRRRPRPASCTRSV